MSATAEFGDDGDGDGIDGAGANAAWILGESTRDVAIAVGGWIYSVATAVHMSQSQAAQAVPGATILEAPSFNGEWVLTGSDNFDAYLASMNVSAVQRKYACSASVTHRIAETRDPAGKTVLQIEVQNRLGTVAEKAVIGGPPVVSKDAQGMTLVKCYAWDSIGKGSDAYRSCVAVVEHSTKGKMCERRLISNDGTMVMELTSPSGVKAKRHFRRVVDGTKSKK